MAIQVILLAIVLASTVIGTLTNAKRWVKAAIIALAILSSFLSILKAYSDDQDGKFIKGALAAEIASTKPTPRFERAFFESLNRAAHTKGMWIYRSVKKDQGTLYFMKAQDIGTEAGIVQISIGQQGQAYVEFVANRSMDAVLRDAMFRVPDLTVDEVKSDVLEELGFIGNIAMDEDVAWVGADTGITRNYSYDPLQVQVKAIEGNNVASVELDTKFLQAILRDPPYIRNLKAFQEAERQIQSSASH